MIIFGRDKRGGDALTHLDIDTQSWNIFNGIVEAKLKFISKILSCEDTMKGV